MPAEVRFLIALYPQGIVDVLKGRQKFGLSVYQRHIVLKMGTGLPVGRKDGPAVFQLAHPPGSHIDHRFNGHHHAFHEFFTPAALSVIRHFKCRTGPVLGLIWWMQEILCY